MVDPQVHNTFPQKFEDAFYKLKDIDIHNPKYGPWVEASEHQAWTYDYIQDWQSFISNNNDATINEIENFAAKKYGFELHF